MKVALCISGQLRTYKDCFSSLNHNLIKPFNPDIFIHTWQDVGASIKDEVGVEHNLLASEEELNKMYSPKKVIILKRPEYISERYNGKVVPQILIDREPIHHKSVLAMYFQIFECNKLAVDYANEHGFEYDLIIRARPDMVFCEKIPMLAIRNVLRNSSLVYYSDYFIRKKTRVSDKFAFGSQSAMTEYCSAWNLLDKYWEDPIGDNPPDTHKVDERLMKFHTDNCEAILAKLLIMDMYILRHSGRKVQHKPKTLSLNRFLKFYFKRTKQTIKLMLQS